MNNSKKEVINILIIFIISFVLVLDLFINVGRSATFDGPTHIANIALFYKSLTQGEWHVTWTDGFANYGMPLGIIAQQFTSYLGGGLNFLVKNVVQAYNLTYLIGAFLSTLFFYFFLRLHFKSKNALLGAFLFNFAPYRIINIYIRGALPEFFASVPLPLILIGIYQVNNKQILKGFLLISMSMAMLILIHPMMVIINSIIVGFYLIYNFFQSKKITYLFISILGMILGFGLAGYYIIPLLIEIKYFYYGLGKNHFIPGQYMSLENFFDPRWFYFYKDDIFTRGHFIKSGVIELIILISGALIIIWEILIKKTKKFSLLSFSILTSILAIYLMTKWAIPLYKIDILSSIQRQWRFLSTYIFLPPIVLAYINQKYGNRILIVILIIIICLTRFPQLYGKNYTYYPESSYFFYQENLHANIMNTIWSGEARDYPVKKTKPEVISGKATLSIKKIKNSLREYSINALTDIRMVDYTFYFPGWRVFVDGYETIIQFQDPAYRGIITYELPKGNHKVKVIFTNTKVRTLGILITVFSLVLFSASIFLLKLTNTYA